PSSSTTTSSAPASYPLCSPISLSYPLLFQPSAAPRLLPSFPTRRSSDLLDASQVQQQGNEPGGDAEEPGQRRADGEHEAPRPHGDRKSTRLNSSHVSISYAVFCLKKKTAARVTSPPPRTVGNQGGRSACT